MYKTMDIQQTFAEIRMLYFPRWDKDKEWQAAFGTPEQLRHNSGYCDTKSKTIFLDYDTFDDLHDSEFRTFMIHEICHDVGAAFHNRRWAKRMSVAARRADKLGETLVAERLRDHIFGYAGNGVLKPYDVPAVIEFTEELFGMDRTIEYEALVQRTAKYFGFTPSKVKRDFGIVIRDVMAGIA